MRELSGLIRVVLLPACVAVVVLGILGMHALDHEATMAEHPGMSMTDTAGAAVEALAAPVVAGAASTPSVSAPEHSMADMMMLCVAMLVAAALGLLLALALRRVARTPSLVDRVRHLVTTLAPQRAGTGPPYVWEFSVIRC